MKLLSKSLLSTVVLSSIMGLAACQNMPFSKSHSSNVANNADMSQGQKNVESLSEGQIIKVLSTANKGEILQAKVAMPKLQSAQIRSFAESMITKHTENETKGQALASSLGIAPQVSHTSNALQTDSNDIVMKLSKTASTVDKEYIKSQIMVHGKVLKTIDEQLLPSAKSPELRTFLAETRAAVAMHLQVAEKINTMMQ